MLSEGRGFVKKIKEKKPLIICNNLYVYAPEDEAMQTPLLENVTLTIYENDWIQLYGWNGSGKSTLLHVLSKSKHYRLQGEIKWLAAEEQPSILTPIVLQQPGAGLIGATAWEDILLLLEQYRLPEQSIIPLVEQILDQFQMRQYSHTPLEHLSGGQLQLVAIAGATAVSNHLLLMDEVTAMLDQSMSRFIIERIRNIHSKQQTAIVWATQKEEELQRTDRVFVVEKGIVTDEGTGEQWLTREKIAQVGSSRCERLGFPAPLYVQLFWKLWQTYKLESIPFSWDEWITEVTKTDE